MTSPGTYGPASSVSGGKSKWSPLSFTLTLWATSLTISGGIGAYHASCQLLVPHRHTLLDSPRNRRCDIAQSTFESETAKVSNRRRTECQCPQQKPEQTNRSVSCLTCCTRRICIPFLAEAAWWPASNFPTV
jgi:hypothetical protein